MPDISATMVNELRAKTGAGLMDCKRALVENQGDQNAAAEWLRKKGIASAVKKADRSAQEGVIASYIHLGGKVGVLIELNCETDFVAKTDEFQALAKDLCMQIAAASPLFVARENVPDELIDKEKEIAAAQVAGKPAPAIEKIVQGKIDKWYGTVCLLEQPFVRDQNKTVKDYIAEAIAKTGENIVVRRFVRYAIGD
ncbi:MAG TPA: translation elongation factor Ts [Opitutales bacterium]|nr:translation elongation factor Ts [Opitutales bacterium]